MTYPVDNEILDLIGKENKRQEEGLEMIPSENFVSPQVLAAMGSILTNKYSEGYPGMRYYGGCEYVDEIEILAQERAKKLFGVDHVNVQPYSGSPANLAVMYALLQPGDTILGLSLSYGGHMTHGLKVNFSGTLYNAVQYTSDENGYLDFDQIRELAREHKPKLIIAGTTAYPRKLEWKKFRAIADEVGAFLMADISHISGLVAAGLHESPVGIADVITTTTHKTLRGPRGAMIMANGNPSTPLKRVAVTSENIPTLVDRAIIPGLQGGPHNHTTAAIATALLEASTDEFKAYAQQVIDNAQALSEGLLEHGFDLVTGGTDNHLLVVDLTNKNVSGADAEAALDKAGITCNKNTVPFDPRSPFDPSGIRLGTPALTTRGMKAEEMKHIAGFINEVINHCDHEEKLAEIRTQVMELTRRFPTFKS
jgi:glycine hydroxymethyltransferase